MGKAIFFAIARNPELKARISQLGCAAGSAFVERLGFSGTRLHLESSTPLRYVFSMPGRLINLGPKKEKIVCHRYQESGAISHRLKEKLKQQPGSRSPGDPFDLQRKD